MEGKNEVIILENIIEEAKGPILNKKNFKSLAIYAILTSLVGTYLATSTNIINVVIGMSILGGLAYVLNDIYLGIKKEEDFRMIVKSYKLFPSPKSCIDYLYMNNLVFGRYNENSRIQIYLQPILSVIAGFIVYFIVRSLMQMSIGGNIGNEPNMFFYGFFAFLSGFSYEKILEILNNISKKISENKSLNAQFLNKIEKFQSEKKEITNNTKIKLKK